MTSWLFVCLLQEQMATTASLVPPETEVPRDLPVRLVLRVKGAKRAYQDPTAQQDPLAPQDNRATGGREVCVFTFSQSMSQTAMQYLINVDVDDHQS